MYFGFNFPLFLQILGPNFHSEPWRETNSRTLAYSRLRSGGSTGYPRITRTSFYGENRCCALPIEAAILNLFVERLSALSTLNTQKTNIKVEERYLVVFPFCIQEKWATELDPELYESC